MSSLWVEVVRTCTAFTQAHLTALPWQRSAAGINACASAAHQTGEPPGSPKGRGQKKQAACAILLAVAPPTGAAVHQQHTLVTNKEGCMAWWCFAVQGGDARCGSHACAGSNGRGAAAGQGSGAGAAAGQRSATRPVQHSCARCMGCDVCDGVLYRVCFTLWLPACNLCVCFLCQNLSVKQR